jgi:hypothetical protein
MPYFIPWLSFDPNATYLLFENVKIDVILPTEEE